MCVIDSDCEIKEYLFTTCSRRIIGTLVLGLDLCHVISQLRKGAGAPTSCDAVAPFRFVWYRLFGSLTVGGRSSLF